MCAHTLIAKAIVLCDRAINNQTSGYSERQMTFSFQCVYMYPITCPRSVGSRVQKTSQLSFGQGQGIK